MLKQRARDLIPKSLQVPVKYFINACLNQLEDELKLLNWIVKAGDNVVDVGANRGVYSYKLWKLGANIEVFEPNPVCLKVLIAWSNNKERVSINGVALSDKAGIAELHIPIDLHGIEHDASASLNNVDFVSVRNQYVDLRTLDSYSFDKVTFIKIDVEGHELNVLSGARNLLEQQKPSLLIEVEQRHCQHSINDIFNFLIDLGYEGYYLDNNKLKLLATFDVVSDQRLEDINKIQKSYINNFLFLHQDKINQKIYEELFKEFFV